jgi:hypothetical protein
MRCTTASLYLTLTRDCLTFHNGIDFCAGGNKVQSPIGALQEMIEMNGFNETSLPAKALKYYGSVSVKRPYFCILLTVFVANQAFVTLLYVEQGLLE